MAHAAARPTALSEVSSPMQRLQRSASSPSASLSPMTPKMSVLQGALIAATTRKKANTPMPVRKPGGGGSTLSWLDWRDEAYDSRKLPSPASIQVLSEQPLRWGEPVDVIVRMPPGTTRSEVNFAGPSQPKDRRLKKAAFLVVLDVAQLRQQGSGRNGIDPREAAQRRLVAEDCQCAPRIRLPSSGVFGTVQAQLQFRPQPEAAVQDGSAQILLQIIVESSMNFRAWAPFGDPVFLRVAGCPAADESHS